MAELTGEMGALRLLIPNIGRWTENSQLRRWLDRFHFSLKQEDNSTLHFCDVQIQFCRLQYCTNTFCRLQFLK